MTRKLVARRLAKAAKARAWLRTHRDLTLGALAQRRAAGDAESSSYRPVFDLVDEELATIELHLAGTEEAYALRTMNLAVLRDERRELAEHVRVKQNAADRVQVALRGFNPGAGVEIDPGAMAEDLETGRQELAESQVEVAEAEADIHVARHLTEIATTQFDDVFPWVERIVSGLIGLGGVVETAGRDLGAPNAGNAARQGDVMLGHARSADTAVRPGKKLLEALKERQMTQAFEEAWVPLAACPPVSARTTWTRRWPSSSAS